MIRTIRTIEELNQVLRQNQHRLAYPLDKNSYKWFISQIRNNREITIWEENNLIFIEA
jgi:hypothetical protein